MNYHGKSDLVLGISVVVGGRSAGPNGKSKKSIITQVIQFPCIPFYSFVWRGIKIKTERRVDEVWP